MLTRRIVQSSLAVLVLVAMLCQGTLVLAGTTGQLSGTAVDSATNAPLAGAKVTAASPSQIATTTTDGSGRFNFLSLAPDTYTVSVEFQGYQATSLSGVTVIADNARTISIAAAKELKTIGTVRTRSSSSLVKPGTTADVYSVDSTTQAKVAGLGGGAELNNAYSAIATVPGAFVGLAGGAQDGNGVGPGLYIRGGDYDQVGFEIDGVPVNRSFDNYPSGPASSLGQQEVQVYTGSAPANAEGQGLAGFINQVIKIGTYPGFVDANIGLGGPAYYHKVGIEIGGATQDRRFSYFLAADGYNQTYRYADNFNGASLSNSYGIPLSLCGLGQTQAQAPSCFLPNGTPYFDRSNETSAFSLGPYNAGTLAQITNRNDVVNLHYGFPHKDGSKDDIQFLAQENFVSSQYYDSINDYGGAAFVEANINPLNGLPGNTAPFYLDAYAYSGPTGVALPSNYQSLTSQYFQPRGLQSSQSGFDGALPVDLRDAISNDQGIYKLQFTKSLGSNALFKLYGYTYYSDWLQVGPASGYYDGFSYYGGPVGPDYELNSHTRGLSGTLSDQINSQNLLSLQASYTTASVIRDNNTQQFNGIYTPGILGSSAGSYVNARTAIGALVNANNPLSGICYTSTGVATTCSYGGPAQFATIYQAYSGTIAPVPTGATTCGGGPCEYLVTNNAQYATYNQVVPKFTSASLTDTIRPSSKLSIDAGLRLDVFQFQGASTEGSAARTFWYNAYNLDTCLNSTNSLFDKVTQLGLSSPTDPCPSGYTAANFQNPSGEVTQTYPVFQPRLGFTYSLDPRTVIRASYGRYAQAPNTAFEQYNALQQNAPALLYGTYGFQKFGFDSPDHRVVPQQSNNWDFSLERSFGDASVKITPFYRATQNQIQQFYLNQQEGFVSGLNVGNQTSKGIEFELDKGNFARDGFAAKLSFTYTNSYIKYNRLSSGGTILDNINGGIQAYNAYTSQCATGGKYAGTSLCGATQTGAPASPCYTTTGAAAPACGPTTIANPYWNAPAQPLLNDNADYATYDVFPAGIGTSADSYGPPYFATFILQYKHGPLAITPNVSFSAGTRYGSPLSTNGIAPDECSAAFGTAAGDPRYPYGAPSGASFNAASCGGLPGIPDPYTGKFDNLGAFAQPSILAFGTQLQYDFTKKLSLVVDVANIVNTCFGGSTTGFKVSGACGYSTLSDTGVGDIGNNYNPGDAIQPFRAAPYEPYFANYPFSVYVSAKLKL
jgi:hypothetical protein